MQIDPARATSPSIGPVTVLMYHAVAWDGDTASTGADPRYTVSGQDFATQLAQMAQAGRRPASVSSLLRRADACAVALTFDDGHCSNARAAEAVLAAGGTADFFVNTATIGTASHLDWGSLRAMADAGMSIQSHGHRHVLLDTLGPADVMLELRRSKFELEDRLGRAVELFAPPGGRMAPHLLETVRGLGYLAVCSSRAGLWRHDGGDEVPRFAVLHRTRPAQFARWIAQDPAELLRQGLRGRALALGKRILGGPAYERLRRGVLQLTGRR